jgi:hypothetical protein
MELKKQTTIQSDRLRNNFSDILILFLAAFAFVRLLAYSINFGVSYLNPDFSDYYTAGEALNAGLSPYFNWVFHDPSIWDGATTYVQSGFLYPPLAGL